MSGLTIFFTGLPSSGKSTLARALALRFHAQDIPVTILDGDIVREHLSAGLGFSRVDRNSNISRIGFVAGEVARHGGVAIVAAIAPYDAARKRARGLTEGVGGRFLLAHVATPLKMCQERDVKGLYAKALAGELEGLTGVDDPYEKPQDAEVTVHTVYDVEKSLRPVVACLRRLR